MSAPDGDLIQPGRGFARTVWVQVPEWLVLADISPAALRLYAIIAAHVNRSRTLPDGTPDRRSFPGQNRLAAMMRVTTRTVQRSLAELVEVDAVSTTAVRWGANNMKRRNIYTVHMDPPRGYSGACSMTSWAREADAQVAEEPQVAPVTTQMSPPVVSPVSHKPDVVTTGTKMKSKYTPAAGHHAPHDGASPDRADQKWLSALIEEGVTSGLDYDDAAASALEEVVDGMQIHGGWMEAVISGMLGRGEVPAKILHTVRKTAEDMR